MFLRPGMRRGPGLLRTAAQTAVIAGTATAVSGAVRRHQNQREAASYATAATADGPAAVPAGGITDEQLNRLERLAELHKSGVLSQEEFEAQKTQILGY